MNLDSTLKSYDDTLAKNPSDMPGEIGAVINGKRKTNVIGRGGFVYVRLRTNLSEPIQAYNDKVFPGFGVAVIVRWANNRYEIVGRDSQRYKEWEADSPEISKHGSSHALDVEGGNIGTDPAWIYPYQLMPGLVSPYNHSGAQNVYVHPFPILYGGEWMYAGNTGTASLTTYSPTSGTVFVLIAVDAETGNPALFATTGTYVTWNISGSNQYISHLPNVDTVRYLPLSFAILQSGTSQISWSNLRDARQWISTSQSGTGGGASLAFQDEGVPLGTPGTVNFVGENISVTISGTVARVFVTGSSGGTTDHNSLTGLQGGTGSQYYHLSYPEWGGLVTGSLTYLHKHSAIDIVTGTIAASRLGSGSASSGTYLRGDQTWATIAGGGDLYNFALNGGADYFQRVDPTASTSLTDGAYNGMDAWYSLVQGAGATEKRDSGIGTAENSLRLTAGGTTNRYGKAQIIHSKKSIPLRGQTVIFQYQVKPTNNAGSGTRDYRIAILAWTGTKNSVTRDVVNDWTSSTYTTGNFFASTSLSLVGTATVTATHGAESVLSVSGSVPTNCNNLIIFFWAEDVPTHASDYAQFSEFGLYVSSSTQTWKVFDGELARCQEYCTKSYATDTAPGTAISTGAAGMYNDATTQTVGWVGFKVTMAGAPTMTYYSPVTGASGKIRSNGADATVSGAGVSGVSGISRVDATLTAAVTSLLHYLAVFEL